MLGVVPTLGFWHRQELSAHLPLIRVRCPKEQNAVLQSYFLKSLENWSRPSFLLLLAGAHHVLLTELFAYALDKTCPLGKLTEHSLPLRWA